jgi:hypothetical protein
MSLHRVCLIALALVEIITVMIDARDVLTARTKGALLRAKAGGSRKKKKREPGAAGNDADGVDDPVVAELVAKATARAAVAEEARRGDPEHGGKTT